MEARKMLLFTYPRESCDFYLTTDERICWVEEKRFVLPLPYARQFCGSFYSLSFRSFDFILDPNYPLKPFRSSYTFVYVEFQTTGQTNKLYVTFIVDSRNNLVVT